MERISSLLLDTQDFQHPSSLLSLVVGIYLNGNYIGWGFVEEYHTYGAQEIPLTLQSTLSLQTKMQFDS
jgi:hypothetical protein